MRPRTRTCTFLPETAELSARNPGRVVAAAAPDRVAVRAPSGRLPGVVLTLALALAFSACSLTPRYTRPEPPLAPAFPAGGATAGPVAAQLPWRDFVGDARTRALVELALQRNRDLRVAALSVEQARAALGVARADQLPSLGAGVSASRSSTTDLYSVGLTLASFEIDLFGRVRALGDVAAARLAASEEARRAAELSLLGAVVDVELALRADDALVAATSQVLAARQGTLELVRARVRAGVAAGPELSASESLVAAARVSLAALERGRLQREHALVLLVGGPLPPDLPAPRPLLQHALTELPPGLPSDVLYSRPDVLQAEQQLVAAHANIGVARAAFFPRISLTGSAGTASTALSGLFERGVWSFGGQLLQPLFDGGRSESALAAAQAGRDAAVALYEKAVQSAFREVADALAARATLAAQLEAQRLQAEADERRLATVQQLVARGAASALERLDAERAVLASRQAVIQVELAVRQNAVLLYRVLGGGTAPR
jgi:NodT family efflux transporter outer membrane factor (OMF) lipoprotein